MRHILTLLFAALSACAMFIAPAGVQAQAQTYPSRPIHVVFPYPPGSPIDAIGRMICERAGKILGQPMVFENRAGANGIIGTSQAARAAADGYTIHLTTTSAFMLNSFLRKDLPYDPLTSFTPIVAVADIPVALVVSARIPVNTTGEFVDYLKRNPGKLNFGSVGNGSFNHLFVEQFKATAGVDMLHVPYQGAGAVVLELTAGRPDATVLGISSVLAQWKAGQVKVLSFMTLKRNPAYPDVPAISEEFPGLRPFGNWMGFVAPAKTPEAIVNRLNEVFVTVLKEPEVRKRIEEQWTLIGNTPAEFRAQLGADLPVIRAAFNAAGIKPE